MSSTNSNLGTYQLDSSHSQAGDTTTSHSHVPNLPPPTTLSTSDEDESGGSSQGHRVQVLRHHDLWFEDGSIVLRAQNPTTLFRVHRAVLARHSEVFRNMFEIPQPPRTRTRTQLVQTPMRHGQGLNESEGSSGSSSPWQQRNAKHHRISKSVDFVKEPAVDGSELRMMGSLSRKLSTLGVKAVFSMGSSPLATSGDYENGGAGDRSNDVDAENFDYNEFQDSCDTDEATTDIDEANAERIERCDVIDMHDSSGDVASLLHALYDGPQWTDNSPADFVVVSGVLRLSHKYLVDGLRFKALEHLHQAWPTTLQGWDLREDRGLAWNGGGSTGSNIVGVGQRECSTNGQNTGTGLMGSNAEGRYPHPITVINLARSTNAPSLLPSAFYDLSRLTYSQIFDGMPAQTQTLSSCDVQKLALGKEQSHQAITSLITNLGNVRCSITGGGGGSGVKIWCCALSHGGNSGTHSPGNAHSHSHSHSRSLPVISRPKSYHAHCHSTCHSPVSCRRDFIELVELATQHYLFDRERGHTDPLYVAEELGQLKSSECSECKACAAALECWSMRERERIWRCLPGWFRVGAGWESLI